MGTFLLKRLFLLLFLIFPYLAHAKENPFVIVITAHNNKSSCQQNLDSVFNQNYHNYRIIYVSDGSTDGSDALVEEHIRQNQQEYRTTHFKNPTQKGELACACQAIFSCNDHEIIVELDGRDWFAHEEVLSTLNEIYADPNVWVVYPNDAEKSAKPIGHAIRGIQVPNVAMHLRSFYAGLFQSIKKEDFLVDGKFFPISDATPYFIPILEMAGGHSKSIPDHLYVRNDRHEEFSKEAEDAARNRLQSMPSYSPLSNLPSFPLMENTPHGQIYGQIKDICHPTLDDYKLLHNYLFHGPRLNLDRLADIYYGQRTIRILGDSPDQIPVSGLVHVNSTGEEKENCILLFSTYNRNYPRGVRRQLNCIINSEFKGDVLYQIGGWPDEEGRGLVLSHVPYAFKVCFIRQAQRLGYKRILWMDSSIVPIANLNEIFGMIQKKGYLIMGNEPFIVGPYTNPQAAAFFGLTHAETHQIPSISAAVFGLDLTQKVGRDLLDHWYRAAQDPDAFFSSRADQNAFSLLLHVHNISDFIPMRRMPHTESNQPITPDSLFSLDRIYIH
ncbi:MAG: glycosyltransferase family 2 protein [Parachlamydiales bacterium]|nr:glycosyltransferase family 2 protein [Candidatus Acheromyda pituitae]